PMGTPVTDTKGPPGAPPMRWISCAWAVVANPASASADANNRVLMVMLISLDGARTGPSGAELSFVRKADFRFSPFGFFPASRFWPARCAGAGTAISSGIKADKARDIWGGSADFSMDSFSHRLAVAADMPVLTVLMNRAIADLLPQFLSPAEVEASFAVMGLDTQLIEDGT